MYKRQASLFNQSASQLTEAEKAEFDRLSSKGTSEQGAVEKVNEILRQIGDLNTQIKRNQVAGQPSLELMDQRNVLLDELSSYVPIEISYYKDDAHSGTYAYTYPKDCLLYTSGWQTIDGKWYYLKADGRMASEMCIRDRSTYQHQ